MINPLPINIDETDDPLDLSMPASGLGEETQVGHILKMPKPPSEEESGETQKKRPPTTQKLVQTLRKRTRQDHGTRTQHDTTRCPESQH